MSTKTLRSKAKRADQCDFPAASIHTKMQGRIIAKTMLVRFAEIKGAPHLILIVTNTVSGAVFAGDTLEINVLSLSNIPPIRGRKVSDEEYCEDQYSRIDQDRFCWEE